MEKSSQNSLKKSDSFCSLSEYDFEIMVQHICEGNVIPIIGEELLQLEPEPIKDIIEKWLSTLKNDVNIDEFDELRPFSIQKISRQILKLKRDIEPDRLARSLYYTFEHYDFDIPESIKLLSNIKSFNFYITTTIDPLLEKSIINNRLSTDSSNNITINKLNKLTDIDFEIDNLNTPKVYYLFGKNNANHDYVVTEEDRLEFMNQIIQSNNRLDNLLKELSNRHILIIGSLYSNWLSRFFIRFLKKSRLSNNTNRYKTWIVGKNISKDEKFCEFCYSSMCYNHLIVETNDLFKFVKNLYTKYNSLFSLKKEIKDTNLEDKIKKNIPFIFFSYCSADYNVAKMICDQLKKNRIQVWFDKHNLKPGHNFNNIIENKINKCSLFIALVTHNTEKLANDSTYFHIEWNIAKQKKESYRDERPFIIPIIQSRDINIKKLSKEFKEANYLYLEQDSIKKEDLKGIINQLRECQL